MRLLFFLLSFLFSATAFGQGNTTAEYYQYQRDQQFKQYMENVSSKGMAGPVNTNFNYSIDKKAVQEMVDLWEKRNKRPGSQYSAEELAKLNAEKKRIEEQKRRDEIAADKAWEQRTLAYSAMMPLYVKMYEEAGFPKAEAEILANERIKEVRPTPNSSLGVLAYVNHPEGDLAYNALKKFQHVKATAPFEDLVLLISDFSFTGYSAVKALEYLEKQFPEKKEIINALKPLYGISFWRPREGYIAHLKGTSLRLEMLNYLFTWMEQMPQATVSLLENGKYWDNLIWDEAESKKQWQQLSRFMVNMAMHGRFGFAQKGQMMERYRSGLHDIKTRKSRENDARLVPKMFSWQDFEAIRNRFNVSGVKAMELLGVVIRREGELGYSFGPSFPWLDPAYHEEVKRYAENGETDARFLYAVNRVDHGSKTEKSEAYKILRGFLEEGYQYVPDVVYNKDIHKELGFGKKDMREYEALKAKCEKQESNVVVNTIHHDLNKPGVVLFDSWQAAKAKYTWSFLETSEADENVHRYVKDDALYFTAKTDNYT